MGSRNNNLACGHTKCTMVMVIFIKAIGVMVIATAAIENTPR
jgi:hypothetical protein